jgi:tetratricopeptide (TPR) repeat protein
MGNTTLFYQALTLERDGRFCEARALFHRCLADPTLDEGDVHFHCGWCLENEREALRAIVSYEKAALATRIPSCKVNSHFRAGWVLMHEKDFANAADAFRNAIDYARLIVLENETAHHAMYWYAFCLESQEQYREALTWYRETQSRCTVLDPESRLRQIVCLSAIGLYGEALDICRSFDAPAPGDFSAQRYAVLGEEVQRERTMLEIVTGASVPSASTSLQP